MKKYLILLCIFELVFLIAFFWFLSPKEKISSKEIIVDSVINYPKRDIEKNQTFLVTYVVDGDTIEIEGEEKVRLICMDTPEKGEEFYDEAKEYLENLVLGKKVELVKDISDKDRYGRLLRYVYADGIFVNEKIVREGYAKMYRYKPDIKLCSVIEYAEEYAKEKERGIWEEKNILKEEEKSENEIGEETYSKENCQCVTDLDCSDFSTHAEAQRCYEHCLEITKKDFHRLDRENDGIACEYLN